MVPGRVFLNTGLQVMCGMDFCEMISREVERGYVLQVKETGTAKG